MGRLRFSRRSLRGKRRHTDPGVQVITSRAGLLGRLPTRQAARLVLEIIEKPRIPHPCDGHLARHPEGIRRDFDPAERTELDMLVLRARRRDPPG